MLVLDMQQNKRMKDMLVCVCAYVCDCVVLCVVVCHGPAHSRMERWKSF
jgi:hypothetical protein